MVPLRVVANLGSHVRELICRIMVGRVLRNVGCCEKEVVANQAKCTRREVACLKGCVSGCAMAVFIISFPCNLISVTVYLYIYSSCTVRTVTENT